MVSKDESEKQHIEQRKNELAEKIRKLKLKGGPDILYDAMLVKGDTVEQFTRFAMLTMNDPEAARKAKELADAMGELAELTLGGTSEGLKMNEYKAKLGALLAGDVRAAKELLDEGFKRVASTSAIKPSGLDALKEIMPDAWRPNIYSDMMAALETKWHEQYPDGIKLTGDYVKVDSTSIEYAFGGFNALLDIFKTNEVIDKPDDANAAVSDSDVLLGRLTGCLKTTFEELVEENELLKAQVEAGCNEVSALNEALGRFEQG